MSSDHTISRIYNSRITINLWCLGNSVEDVVHHLLIRGMTGFGYQYEFSIMSALVCTLHIALVYMAIK